MFTTVSVTFKFTPPTNVCGGFPCSRLLRSWPPAADEVDASVLMYLSCVKRVRVLTGAAGVVKCVLFFCSLVERLTYSALGNSLGEGSVGGSPSSKWTAYLGRHLFNGEEWLGSHMRSTLKDETNWSVPLCRVVIVLFQQCSVKPGVDGTSQRLLKVAALKLTEWPLFIFELCGTWSHGQWISRTRRPPA